MIDGPGVFEKLHVRPKVGPTLIVGSQIYVHKQDRRKLHAEAVGVDMIAGPGVDVVADLEMETIGMFAHIECMSVLEHCRRPWLMAANLERMLEPGGTIYVTAPFVWRVHGYPDDYWRFTINGIKSLFTRIDWKAESYAHKGLCKGDDVPCVKIDELPHFGRSEVCLFGVLE